VIDLRDEAARHNQALERRLDTLVPQLLAETGIDCWVLIGREYAEDPVLMSMLPAEWLSARRRTILVLTATDRLAVSRYPVRHPGASLFRSVWDPDAEPDQWTALAAVLAELDPDRIGVGTSPTQAHADGLTASERDTLLAALPKALADRVVSAGTLGIRWLETRLPEEHDVLEEAAGIAHRILRRGLSSEAIDPGTTTIDDLVWWYRQTVHELGLSSWFQPSVGVQRDASLPDTAGGGVDVVIRRGDLVHVDFGIRWRGLCTDQQEHAYVLHRGEHAPPKGLEDGLRTANRVQDLLIEQFVVGRTGNEILARTLAEAGGEGIEATIYSHSIGIHGHGAGMTIGLWDQQGGVPGAGDHALHVNTAYSIELMAACIVPEWQGQKVRFMVEQDAWFDGATCSWLDARQERLWVI
jgi:Xaa-Pro aminopeptidase